MHKCSKKYCCSYCNRDYKEKFNYDRHIGFCEFSHKSVKERENEIDEFENTPNLKDIFKYVKELSVRVSTLEKENSKLKQLVNIEQRKIEILDWLNTQKKPNITFTDWITNIPFKEYLQVIFNNDLITGIIQCLDNGSNNITITDYDKIPFRAFSNKTKYFYIYDKLNNDENEWFALSHNDFHKWINYIAKNFLIEFKTWVQENENEINHNELMKENYFNNFQKVLGNKTTDEIRNHRICLAIYNKIKQNVKNIVIGS